MVPSGRTSVTIMALVSQEIREVELINVDLMLGQRRRRWTNIKSALSQRFVFAGFIVADTYPG